MAYKAPLLMRIFHYALWTVMLFIIACFFLIPIFLRVTAPKPTRTPESPTESSSPATLGSQSQVPIQQPATTAVTP